MLVSGRVHHISKRFNWVVIKSELSSEGLLLEWKMIQMCWTKTFPSSIATATRWDLNWKNSKCLMSWSLVLGKCLQNPWPMHYWSQSHDVISLWSPIPRRLPVHRKMRGACSWRPRLVGGFSPTPIRKICSSNWVRLPRHTRQGQSSRISKNLYISFGHYLNLWWGFFKGSSRWKSGQINKHSPTKTWM